MRQTRFQLPEGYVLVRTCSGPAVRNFGAFGSLGDPSDTWNGQTAYCFVRGDDWRSTLVAVVAPLSAPKLALVEGGESRAIAVEAGEESAEYHSGIWSAAGGRSDQSQPARPMLEWNRNIHSVTVNWQSHKVVARGPAQVTIAALARVAVSVSP